MNARSKGRIECAAQPASSARARTPPNRRASPTAERIPQQPEAEHRPGVAREASAAPWRRRAGRGGRPGTARCSLPVGAGVVGVVEAGGGRLERAAVQDGRAVVERVGHRERRAGSSAARARPAAGCGTRATGWPSGARPSSGRAGSRARSARPSACRRRSPASASSTSTDAPAWARRTAAASPLGPEPTTTTSVWRIEQRLLDRARAYKTSFRRSAWPGAAGRARGPCPARPGARPSA